MGHVFALVGLIPFWLGVELGAWRRRFPAGGARRGPRDRLASCISWIAVTALSVVGALFNVYALRTVFPEVVAWCFFGIMLAARWLLSLLCVLGEDASANRRRGSFGPDLPAVTSPPRLARPVALGAESSGGAGADA